MSSTKYYRASFPYPRDVITHNDVSHIRNLVQIKKFAQNTPKHQATVYAWGSLKGSLEKIKNQKEKELRECLFEKDKIKILEELREIEELKKSHFNFR